MRADAVRRCALLAVLALLATPAAAGAPEAIAVNVLVEPDAALTARALALNAQLRAAYPAGFALGEGHAPHLTVLQRCLRRDRLDAALAAVARVVAGSAVPGSTLRASGLYAARFAGLGMVAARVDAEPALASLQDALVAALAPFAATCDAAAFAPEPGGAQVGAATVDYVRDFVPRASGARYVPHVTVGVAAAADADRVAASAFAPLEFRVQAVAVYQLGDLGTARRRLWPAAQGAAVVSPRRPSLPASSSPPPSQP